MSNLPQMAFSLVLLKVTSIKNNNILVFFLEYINSWIKLLLAVEHISIFEKLWKVNSEGNAMNL